ncbi:hypothetical protein HYR53_10600 [Candidatus Acetothermia bacterium]|nr:hypothetical protein [Candidatus Acetothermia bacterium]
MREFNYLWLSAEEICKRLGLAISCFSNLTLEEQERVPKLNGNIRADVAFHLIRPEMIGRLCESCLMPLKASQNRYCSTLCRNTHIVGKDHREQTIEVGLTNDFLAQILEDAHVADLPLSHFVRIAVEYGRHQVLLFLRTGNSQVHDRLRDEESPQ